MADILELSRGSKIFCFKQPSEAIDWMQLNCIDPNDSLSESFMKQKIFISTV